MLLKEFQGMDRTAEIDNETGNKDEQLNFEENNSPGEDNELDDKSFEHTSPNSNEELESERAGSSKQTKNNTNNEIKNQWFHLSKPLQNIKLPADLYVKCVFNKAMKTLAFMKGNEVERPEGTCFRLGYEVFLCPKYRSGALGKIFIFLGVFVTDLYHPLSNLALLLDIDAFEKHKSTDNAAIECSNMFRVAPIQFVGQIPGGKVYEDFVEMVDTAVSLASIFFENFSLKGKTLQELDFIPVKPKLPASINTKRTTRSKNAELKETHPLFDTKQPGSTVVLDVNAKTPPFVRKISDRTANKVLEGMKRTNCAALQKEQTKSARLGAENKALKDALAEAKTEIAALKAENKRLHADAKKQIINKPRLHDGAKMGKQTIAAESEMSSPSPETYKPKVNPSKPAYVLMASSTRKSSPQKRFVLFNENSSPSPIVHRSKYPRCMPLSRSPSVEYVRVKSRSSSHVEKRRSEFAYPSDSEPVFKKSYRKYK